MSIWACFATLFGRVKHVWYKEPSVVIVSHLARRASIVRSLKETRGLGQWDIGHIQHEIYQHLAEVDDQWVWQEHHVHHFFHLLHPMSTGPKLEAHETKDKDPKKEFGKDKKSRMVSMAWSESEGPLWVRYCQLPSFYLNRRKDGPKFIIVYCNYKFMYILYFF